MVVNDSLTVIRACNYLHHWFKASEEEIQFAGEHMTLAEFIERFPGLLSLPASGVVIRFFGGPPGYQGFFNGTLSTFLNDKILKWNLRTPTVRVEKTHSAQQLLF